MEGICLSSVFLTIASFRDRGLDYVISFAIGAAIATIGGWLLYFLINSYKKDTILALSYDGKRGNPVIFPSSLYNELISLNIDETGQKVINAHLDILKLYDTTVSD